jgi:hypothetical protein
MRERGNPMAFFPRRGQERERFFTSADIPGLLLVLMLIVVMLLAFILPLLA